MSGAVNQIGRLVPGLQGQGIDASLKPEEEKGPAFTEVFGRLINSVNELQSQAAHAQQLAATGDAAELHQVMIAVEEAGIAMDLLLAVRNKLVDAYNTLIQMPM
jgi:flagellar hook-basal body complex protein FliE